jgi:hypothetical protein
MTKPRRKAEIRADAHRKLAALRDDANARGAFLQPIARSWHDRFLRAIGAGLSIEKAATASGITRQGVYYARRHQPEFEGAFRKAYSAGRKLRRLNQLQSLDAAPPQRSSTTKGNRSAQKRANDSVTLGKSDFTLRVGVNGPTEGYPLRNQGAAGLVSVR